MLEELFISRLKEGDAASFEMLVKQYGSKIYNTSLSIVQHEEDAEDITQEVFTEVFQSIHNFKGASKLSTWIYRIAVTCSLEFLRKKKRQKRFGLMQSIFGSDGFEDVPHFIHPGIVLENKEKAKVLFTAIDKLAENQKTAFILHKAEGLTYTEVAEVMQVSVSSVESLLFRAKQKLQKLLSDYYQNK